MRKNTKIHMIHIVMIWISIFLLCFQIYGEELHERTISPVEYDENGMPIIQVKLHSLKKTSATRSFRFIVDTGCGGLIIDNSIPSEFFQKAPSHSITFHDAYNKRIITPSIIIKRMELGGITRKNIPGVRMDLKRGPIGRHMDDPVDGLIGMSFLNNTRFVLDPIKKQLEWWGEQPRDGATLPLTYRPDGCPHITLTINKVEIPGCLDTAMNDGLDLPAHLCPAENGKTIYGASSLQEKIERTLLKVDRIGAGPYAWNDVRVSFSPGIEQAFIGQGVFSTGPVCFDFIDHLVTLPIRQDGFLSAKDYSLNIPVVWDRTPKKQKLIVLLVAPNSPMAKAGCLPGDEIIRAGAYEGKTLNRRVLMELMTKGGPYQWTVLREGVQIRLEFR